MPARMVHLQRLRHAAYAETGLSGWFCEPAMAAAAMYRKGQLYAVARIGA